jgi:hypothetical protein
MKRSFTRVVSSIAVASVLVLGLSTGAQALGALPTPYSTPLQKSASGHLPTPYSTPLQKSAGGHLPMPYSTPLRTSAPTTLGMTSATAA